MANNQLEGYIRYPTIAGNTIVFVAEDDLWTVDAGGGVARRLTTMLSKVSWPALSPDGKLVAFVAHDDGPSEVYVMPAEGGPATRLTYLGSNVAVSGWDHDGHILFTSDANSPFAGWRFAYRVDPNGGMPEPLNLGPAQHLAVNTQGGVVLSRNERDSAHWKRYRGGSAGHFWVRADEKSEFIRWDTPDGNLGSPMWFDGRVFYISDHEGYGNLYSATPEGTDVRRHTDFDVFYARNARTDGKRIVFHAGGDVYMWDPVSDTGKKVAIDLVGPRTQLGRKYVPAANHLESTDLHPRGHCLLTTVRGRVYSFGNWEGPVLEHTEVEGTRFRDAKWLPDGKRFVVISETDDGEVLELHDSTGEDETVLFDFELGQVTGMEVAPKGNKLAVTTYRNELFVIDLDSKEKTLVEKNEINLFSGMTWSHDGTWLAYSAPFSRHTRGLKLWREGQDAVRVSKPVLADVRPSFDPNGKYLYFISYRVFNPVYDDLQFDLGFLYGGKPALITLQADTVSPFMPAPKPLVEGGRPTPIQDEENDQDEGSDEEAKGNQEAVKSEDTPSDQEDGLTIDLDGIEDRVLMLPVPEARYQTIQGIDGKVLFTSSPASGVLSMGDSRPKGTLHVYDFKELKHDTLAQGVTGLGLSLDRKTKVLWYGKRLRVLAAGRKPDDKPDRREASRASGWVNLGRLKVAVYPGKEWPQMLRQAWRLQKERFWTEDLSGIDWDLIWQRYSRLLPRLATRSDLSDLMWEMQGELGTSHAYESGGDYRPAPAYGQGFLGAEFVYDEKTEGYRITDVIEGDSWADDSSLRMPGVQLTVGDVIIAMDNRRLSAALTPAHCLVGKGGLEVALRIIPAAGGDARTVTVKALTGASHQNARYRAWVESNRTRVHAASNGRLGYVHIPDMGGSGYAEFHRSWLAESDKDGLIIDVRHNRGGHVSGLLLEKLSRRPIGFSISRWGAPDTYPDKAIMGPLVAITNERAGSDGDIFSHGFKLQKLGPLIGKRTWGGVIGIWPKLPLVDGTVTTQPEYAFWFPDVKWGVENYGTDPDIDVDDHPEAYRDGLDPQLERGIHEALNALEQEPVKWPDFDDRPDLSLPVLPPRNKGKEEQPTA